MSQTADFEAAFTSAVERAARELAGEAEGTVSDHPGVDELVDFQEGRLAGDDAERVRGHLAACEECAREVRELEGFDVDQSTDAELRPSPEQTAADWARFQQIVQEDAPPPAGDAAGGKVLEMRSATEAPRRRRLRDWLPAAAALIIGLIGGFGIASQRTTPADTPAPRYPYAVDLVPDGEELVRDAGMVADVALPPGMDVLVARLNLGDQRPYDAYRAEITDSAGIVAWSQDGLRRQPAGQFVVLVDRAQLPAGSYRLSVFGAEGDDETVLATYTFELSYATEP